MFKNLFTKSKYIIKKSEGSVIYYDRSTKVHHREDGPAVEYSSGVKEWWLNGQLHREDGPAIECPNGTKEWWINGRRHRGDGPAYTTNKGHEVWFKEGQIHREDGPAIIGTSKFLIDEYRIELACTYYSDIKEWYIEGHQMTQKEFNIFTSDSKSIFELISDKELQELLMDLSDALLLNGSVGKNQFKKIFEIKYDNIKVEWTKSNIFKELSTFLFRIDQLGFKTDLKSNPNFIHIDVYNIDVCNTESESGGSGAK